MNFKTIIVSLSIIFLFTGTISAIPRTDIIQAIESDNLNAVKTLLDLNVDIKRTIETSENNKYAGSSFLHIAAQHSNPLISELLISRGANINQKDNKGLTPAFIAIKNRSCNVLFTIFKSKSFDPKITDPNGEGIFSKAIEGNEPQCIGAILESGKFNINTKDKDGYTPEVKASLKGNALITHLLKIAAGKEDPDSKVLFDKAEKKVLDFVDYAGDYTAVFLLKKGASLPDEKNNLEYFKTVITMEKDSRMSQLYGRKYLEDYAKSVDLLSRIDQKLSEIAGNTKDNKKVPERPEYLKNLTKVWERNEFHSMFIDKERVEVKNLLGNPHKVGRSGKQWDYSVQIKDPESGRVFRTVSFIFSSDTGGSVEKLNYFEFETSDNRIPDLRKAKQIKGFQ